MKDIRELQKVFAERLNGLMVNKDYTRASLSRKIGIPASTIGNYLNMRRTPQIDTLYTIADFFGVTTDYLLGLEK